jgi:hypothetical protein
MSATPTYDAVVEDLRIDPTRIAARPAWSFEIAERVRKHQKKVWRSATPDKRIDQPRSDQSASQHSHTETARAGEGQRKRPVAAS